MVSSPLGLVDSHCHLNYLFEKDHVAQLPAVLKRANDKGVHHFLCIAVDIARIDEVLSIAHAFKQVKASVGVHPCDVTKTPKDTMAILTEHAQSDEVVAIGETGLDYYHEEGLDKALQHTYFSQQIHLSMTVNKPLIVHTRSAREDTISILQAEGKYKARGVLHCFTETLEMAKAALDLGFYISFSGIITFKNAESIREVCKYCPMDRILVETDAPYLAPVPFRGKPNEPSYVHYVASSVAMIKNLSYEKVVSQTTENVQTLFGWPCN